MVNYGEFIDRAYDLANNLGVSLYVEDWMKLATPDQWKEYRQMQLTKGLVINFAEDMSTFIYERLSGICTDGFYTIVYNDGHAFLRAIHKLSKECGLEIELKRIDSSITPTDHLIESEYIGLDDQGRIVLK